MIQYVIDPGTTLPLLVPGTLSIIADADPVIQPGQQARTVLLEVIKGGQKHFFANTRLVTGNFEGTMVGALRLDHPLLRIALFRQVAGVGVDMARSLRELFGVTGEFIPIVARVREPLTPSDRTRNSLGTVINVPVDIGFAVPSKGASKADPEEEE